MHFQVTGERWVFVLLLHASPTVGTRIQGAKKGFAYGAGNLECGEEVGSGVRRGVGEGVR